jgi:hypothetical protein
MIPSLQGRGPAGLRPFFLRLFTGVRGIGILRSWALPEELSRRAFLRLRTAALTPHLHNLALLHTEDVDDRLL